MKIAARLKIAFIAACIAAGVVGAPAQARMKVVHKYEGDHFILQWVESPDEQEVEGVRAEVAAIYARTVEFLGEKPGGKVSIFLAGPAQQPNGSWESPRVDAMGQIYLFRYTDDYQNYFGALAHEMVHAFRIDRRATADGSSRKASPSSLRCVPTPRWPAFPGSILR